MPISANIVANGVVLLAVALLLYIAWYDFWHLKIRNGAVLLLLALYAIWLLLGGVQSWAGDLGTGLILFLIGFVMWRARMMGGGDVKLYFALGLFMGFANLGLFAIGLLLTSLLFLLALRLAAGGKGNGYILCRLRVIGDSGRAPYAVPLCLAAIPVILLRVNSLG
ncbi:MAG: prepilin peptidase [Rhodobacteraceae bacterium]|nr:prepilin peptidase [Paracoccaceae bacterium]